MTPQTKTVPPPPPTATDGQVDTQARITLDLSVREADALRNWLLKSTADGATALDDNLVNSTLTELGRALEYVKSVSAVRKELRQAGFETEGLSDGEIAELGRRIREASQPGIR
jgi:hypothetical protein